MIRVHTVIIFLVSIVNSYAVTDSALVLTPGYENIMLAKIDGKVIKEFDVFGAPTFAKSRSRITNSKRAGKIQDYILDTIFQTEGNTAEIRNSTGYRKTYKLLVEKEAVNRYREDLIDKKFLNNEQSKAINLYISKILDSLKIAHEVVYNEELFNNISNINVSDPQLFADSLLLLGAKKELITYKGRKSTVQDLYRVAKELKPYHMDNLRKVKVLKSLIEGNILNALLTNIAESNGYFEDEKVKEKTLNNMKYFISSEYKKRIFSDEQLKPTKDETIDYYIEHKDDSELKTIRKMWTYEIFKTYDNSDGIESNNKIKVALELENIRQKILAGESFEKYAKFYARPNTRDGELGYIYRTDHAMIGKTAYQLEVGEISDLIIQKKAISIIKVTEIKEPQLYKFDYVEEIIKRRVIDKKRDELKKELKMKLFKKYKVELMNAQ